jgi:hypothetical protein
MLTNAGKPHSYISLLSKYLGDKALLRPKGLASLYDCVWAQRAGGSVCTCK